MLLVFNVIFFLLFFDKLLAEHVNSSSDSSADAGKTTFICPGIGLYSDTSDCHKYHQCGIEGEPPISSTACPTEMNFDTLERECRPVSRANCELCEKDGFFVDKSSPYTYIQCTGGMGEVARCLPAGTIFNFDAQACETDPNGQAVKGAYDYYPGVNNFGYDFHPIFYPYQEQLRRQHKWSPHLQNFISKGSVKAESQAKAGPVNGLASSQTKTNYNTALAHSQTFIGEPNGNETKPNEPFLGELGTMGGEYSTVHAMATATGTGKAREEEALPVPSDDEDGDDLLDPEEKEAALQAQEDEAAAADPSVARPQDPVYKVPSNEQEEEDGPVGPADIIAGPGAGSRSVANGASLPSFGSAAGSRGLGGGAASKSKSKSRSAGGSNKRSRSMAARLPTFGATSGSRSLGGSPASSKPRTRSLGGIPAEVIEEIEVEEVDPTAGNSTDGTPKTRKVKKKVKKHIPAVPYPSEVNSNDVVSPSDGANRYDEKVRPLLAKPWKYATTNAGGPRVTETGDLEDEAAEIHGSWVDGGDSSLPLSKPIDGNLNDEVDATGQEKIFIMKKKGGSLVIDQPIKIGAGAKKAETNQKVQEEQVEQTQTAGTKERYEILMNDGHAIAEKPRDGSQVYKYYGPIQIVHVTKEGKRETVATLDEHTGDAHSSGGSGKNKNPDLDDSGNFIKVVVSNLHGKRRVAPPKSVTKKSFPLGSRGPGAVIPVTSDDQVPSSSNADSDNKPDVDVVKEIIPDTGHTNGTRSVGGGSSGGGDHGGSSPNVEAQASALAYRGNTKHGADPDSGRRPTPRPTLGPLVKSRSGGGGGGGGGKGGGGTTNTYRNADAAKESQNNWDLGWNQRSGSKYDFPGGGGNNLNMQFAGNGGSNLNNQKTSGGGSNLNIQNARGGGSNLNNQRTSGGGNNLNNQNARGGGSNLNNQRTAGGGNNLNIQNANGGGNNLNNQNAGGGGGDWQADGNVHQRAGGRGGRRGGRRRRPGAGGGRRGGRRRRPQNPENGGGEHDPNAPKSGDPFAFNWAGDTHNQERFNDTALFPFSHTFDHDSAVQEGLNYDWKTGKEYGGEEHGQVPVSYEKSFGNSQSSAYKTHLTENKNENTTFTAGKSETADTEQEYAQEKKNGSTKSMKKDKSKKGEQTASTHLGQDGEHRVVAIGKSEHDEKTNVSELDDHTGESRNKLHEKKLEHRNETDLRRDKEGTVKFGSLDKLTGYERLNDTFLGDERHEAESVDKKISSEKKTALEKNDTSERKLESEKIASTDAQALFKNISGVEFHKGSSKSLTMDASTNLEADGDDVRAFMNNNTYSTDTESLKNKTEDEELAIAHQRVRGGEANKAFVSINGSKKLDDYSTIIGSDTSSKTNKSGDREQISSVQTQMVGHTDRQGEEEANPDGTVRSKFATQNDNDASQKTLVVERVNKEDGTPDTEKITQTKKTKTNTGNTEVKTVADVDSNTSQSVKATSGNSSQTSEGSEKFHILSDQGRRSEAEARKRVLHLPPEDPNEKPDRLPSEGVDPNAPPVTEGPDEDSEEHNGAGAGAAGPGAGANGPHHGGAQNGPAGAGGSDDDYYDDYYDTPLPGGASQHSGAPGGSNINHQNANAGHGGSASNQAQQNIVDSKGNSGTSGNSNGNIAISIYQNSGSTGGGAGAPHKDGSAPNVVVYKDGSRNNAGAAAPNVAVYNDGKPVQPSVSQSVGGPAPGGAGGDDEYYDDEYYDDDEPEAPPGKSAMGSSLPPKDPKELKPAGSQFWSPEENAEWIRGNKPPKKKKKKKKPGKGRPKVSKLKPKKENKIKYDDDGAGAAGFAVAGNREGAPSAYAASYSKGKNTKSGSSAAAGNGGAKAVAVAKRIRTSKGNSTAPA